MQLMEE